MARVAGAMLSGPSAVSNNAARVRHRDELKRLLEAQLAPHTRQHWTALFCAAGIPAGPINNVEDVFRDEQVLHCGLVEQVEHTSLGAMRLVASPIQMHPSAGPSVRSAPPLLGEHTGEVLREYGYAQAVVDGWLKEGVVACAAA